MKTATSQRWCDQRPTFWCFSISAVRRPFLRTDFFFTDMDPPGFQSPLKGKVKFDVFNFYATAKSVTARGF